MAETDLPREAVGRKGSQQAAWLADAFRHEIESPAYPSMAATYVTCWRHQDVRVCDPCFTVELGETRGPRPTQATAET